MSLKDFGFKGWAVIVITAIWLACNLAFPAKEAAEPYFKIHNIESEAEQIADKRFERAEARQQRSRRYFWNKHKAAKEIKREVVGNKEQYADEELLLGFVPKQKFAFLSDFSVKNSVAAWKIVLDDENADKWTPETRRGFWSPIVVLAILALCLLFGGNIFRPLRRRLKELPEVDAATENDEDDEESNEENDEDDDVESNEEDEQ